MLWEEFFDEMMRRERRSIGWNKMRQGQTEVNKVIWSKRCWLFDDDGGFLPLGGR